jgi:hypothetical protein
MTVTDHRTICKWRKSLVSVRLFLFYAYILVYILAHTFMQQIESRIIESVLRNHTYTHLYIHTHLCIHPWTHTHTHTPTRTHAIPFPLAGPDWKILTGAGQPRVNPQSSPGYNHTVFWPKWVEYITLFSSCSAILIFILISAFALLLHPLLLPSQPIVSLTVFLLRSAFPIYSPIPFFSIFCFSPYSPLPFSFYLLYFAILLLYAHIYDYNTAHVALLFLLHATFLLKCYVK